MSGYKDIITRYPEVEQPLRLDGSPDAIKKCLEPVLEKLDRILKVVDDITFWKELEYLNVFLFQSRALGTCKKTSDIDIYIQLAEVHRDLVKKGGAPFGDSGIVIFVGGTAKKFFSDLPKHIHEELAELHVDFFFGIEPIPPAKDWYGEYNYYIELKELKKVK